MTDATAKSATSRFRRSMCYPQSIAQSKRAIFKALNENSPISSSPRIPSPRARAAAQDQPPPAHSPPNQGRPTTAERSGRKARRGEKAGRAGRPSSAPPPKQKSTVHGRHRERQRRVALLGNAAASVLVNKRAIQVMEGGAPGFYNLTLSTMPTEKVTVEVSLPGGQSSGQSSWAE